MTKRLVLKAALAVLLASTIFFFYRPIGLVLLVTLGRSPACSFHEVFRCYYENRAGEERARETESLSVQLLQRDHQDFELWRTPRGDFWTPPGSDSMVRWLLHEMERGLYRDEASGTGVRRGDVVLDCGAHIGVFTKEALEYGAHRVIAVEPAPENLECLRRNLEIEIQAGQVRVVEKGVWDKEEVLLLHTVPGFSAGDSFLGVHEGSRGIQKLPLTTIDRLVEELEIERIDFIKMNIEGAEQRALDGARTTLSRFKPRMAIATFHLSDDAEKIPQIIHRAQSDYQVGCGACVIDKGRALILPEVMYFY